MEEQRSYWELTAFPYAHDLVVVGAGITGLSAALIYRQRFPDRSVVVLERGSVPSGASTRNAGFACIGSISEHRADLERTSVEEVKKRIRRRYNGLERLKAQLGQEAIGYEACGGEELFVSEEAFREAEQDIPRFNGWLADLIGQREVYSSGERNGYPVIRNRLEGALHAGKMMRALIRKAERAGVAIRWNAEVRSVGPEGAIEMADGASLAARQVLVAVNGFAARLLPDIEVAPGRGLVMVTAPIAGLPWRGTFHHDRGYIYFRNIGDRLLLGGARNIAEREERTDRFGANPEIRRHLVAFADEVLKLPEGWTVEHQWSGIMGFTETKSPVIRRVDNRISVAAGLSGMGVAIGMEVGEKAAALLAEGD